MQANRYLSHRVLVTSAIIILHKNFWCDVQMEHQRLCETIVYQILDHLIIIHYHIN